MSRYFEFRYDTLSSIDDANTIVRETYELLTSGDVHKYDDVPHAHTDTVEISSYALEKVHVVNRSQEFSCIVQKRYSLFLFIKCCECFCFVDVNDACFRIPTLSITVVDKPVGITFSSFARAQDFQTFQDNILRTSISYEYDE
jgi:hypothetical protein